MLRGLFSRLERTTAGSESRMPYVYNVLHSKMYVLLISLATASPCLFASKVRLWAAVSSVSSQGSQALSRQLPPMPHGSFSVSHARDQSTNQLSSESQLELGAESACIACTSGPTVPHP